MSATAIVDAVAYERIVRRYRDPLGEAVADAARVLADEAFSRSPTGLCCIYAAFAAAAATALTGVHHEVQGGNFVVRKQDGTGVGFHAACGSYHAWTAASFGDDEFWIFDPAARDLEALAAATGCALDREVPPTVWDEAHRLEGDGLVYQAEEVALDLVEEMIAPIQALIARVAPEIVAAAIARASR